MRTLIHNNRRRMFLQVSSLFLLLLISSTSTSITQLLSSECDSDRSPTLSTSTDTTYSLFSSLSPLLFTSASACADPAPIKTGDVINVALLIWIDAPPGVYTGDILSTNATTQEGYGTSFIQPYMLGLDLYVQKMRAKNPMPLPNGESVTWNFIYINLANAITFTIPGTIITGDIQQWNYERTLYNLPLFIGASQSVELPGSFMYPGTGLIYKIVSQDPAVLLKEFNITTPFKFIIPSPLWIMANTAAMVNLVEDNLSHIIIHPFATDEEMFVCDASLNISESTTPDCIPRGRREGARRFQTFFSTMHDSSSSMFAAIDHFHTIGLKTAVMLREPAYKGGDSAYWDSLAVLQAAKQMNIQILDVFVMEDGTEECSRGIDSKPYCPPLSIQLSGGQTQIWMNHSTGMDIAKRIAALKPQGMILIGTPSSGGAWSFSEVFRAFHTIDFTPEVISIGGGMDGILPDYLPNGIDDIMYSWNTKPWDPLLTGPSYRNLGSASDFQLLPATDEYDSPQAFANEFEKLYGPNRTGGGGKPHPFYSGPCKGNSVPALAYATLERMQKIVEAGLSHDVGTLLDAAKSVSRPGMFGRVRFDVYGRTELVSDVLQQQMPHPVNLQILSPYNLGEPTVYPIPTWSERVFDASVFYASANEQVMLIFNSVSIIFITIILLLILYYHREPIIRAATPSFCITSMVGLLCMLISNYFSTLNVNNIHCHLSTWLLTIGFTLTYVSMFIKTARIWIIFGRTKLKVTRVRNWELLLAVGAFVAVDIILNVVWMTCTTSGMNARRVTVDPVRPKYDYMQCDSTDAKPFIFAHLAIKGGMLLVGVLITYAVRNVPNDFNESTMLGFAIYNVTFCVGFGLPIVAVGLGGRETTYLLRAYIIMFITLSTCGLLYIPKLSIIIKNLDLWENNVTKMGDGNHSTAGGTGSTLGHGLVGGEKTGTGGLLANATNSLLLMKQDPTQTTGTAITTYGTGTGTNNKAFIKTHTLTHNTTFTNGGTFLSTTKGAVGDKESPRGGRLRANSSGTACITTLPGTPSQTKLTAGGVISGGVITIKSAPKMSPKGSPKSTSSRVPPPLQFPLIGGQSLPTTTHGLLIPPSPQQAPGTPSAISSNSTTVGDDERNMPGAPPNSVLQASSPSPPPTLPQQHDVVGVEAGCHYKFTNMSEESSQQPSPMNDNNAQEGGIEELVQTQKNGHSTSSKGQQQHHLPNDHSNSSTQVELLNQPQPSSDLDSM